MEVQKTQDTQSSPTKKEPFWWVHDTNGDWRRGRRALQR